MPLDAEAPSSGRPPVLLVVGFGLFLVLLVYLVTSSLTRRTQPTFEPTPPGATGRDTLTVDATDERTWRFVDLDRGAVVLPPDTAGWDLAVRRFRILAAGSAADVGATPFDALATAPDSGYITGADRDSSNAALRRWYAYSMLSHLLEPNGHLYVVRTREGRRAKLEFLSYYCPGLRAGCLTFRYAWL